MDDENVSNSSENEIENVDDLQLDHDSSDGEMDAEPSAEQVFYLCVSLIFNYFRTTRNQPVSMN